MKTVRNSIFFFLRIMTWGAWGASSKAWIIGSEESCTDSDSEFGKWRAPPHKGWWESCPFWLINSIMNCLSWVPLPGPFLIPVTTQAVGTIPWKKEWFGVTVSEDVVHGYLTPCTWAKLWRRKHVGEISTFWWISREWDQKGPGIIYPQGPSSSDLLISWFPSLKVPSASQHSAIGYQSSIENLRLCMPYFNYDSTQVLEALYIGMCSQLWMLSTAWSSPRATALGRDPHGFPTKEEGPASLTFLALSSWSAS